MADLFWLLDEQWAVMVPFMPKDQPGPERKDDRQIISGIVHVLVSGCRRRDWPLGVDFRWSAFWQWSMEADIAYAPAHDA